MSEPVIKVWDILFPRLRIPDLDRMEEFLTEFGMVRAERTSDALYMRGTDGEHHLHVTHRGEPGLIGFGFQAQSLDDLEKLAKEDGASEVHTLDEPGGGQRVILNDPHGFQVDVIHGMEPVAPLESLSVPLNLSEKVERVGVLQRIPPGPAHVKRLGHSGLNVPDLQRAFDWYHRHLGIIPTDSVQIESDIALRFCRCDRGDTYTDHHSFLLVQSQGGDASFNHCSYEVRDIDDVYMGHEHLQQKGYVHWWGIGRHTIGSQVFDYWNSPWGQVHEHYTDGDLLNRDYEEKIVPVTEIDSQWGPKTPPSVEMAETE